MWYEQGESQADFTYGYSHSIRDGVCRPILFPSYEGELTWLSDGREHRATFEDGLTFERQRERLKTALLQETWLGPVLSDAHAELQRLRKQEQADAGGLIVTMNQTMRGRWPSWCIGSRASARWSPSPTIPLPRRPSKPCPSQNAAMAGGREHGE